MNDLEKRNMLIAQAHLLLDEIEYLMQRMIDNAAKCKK